MNPLHEMLDALLPFDFSDPDVRRIVLRAIPFTLVSAFLFVNVLTILIRSVRGAKDSQVISQVFVKLGLIVYLGLLAWNYWGHPAAQETVFDANRVWMGVGAAIGFPIAVVYLVFAIRDEWRYRRLRHSRRRNSPRVPDGMP